MQEQGTLIVGGGNAGISLAARLVRNGERNVTLVSPESVHRYRPLLNYVGAGESVMADLERPTRALIPDGVTWIEDAVVSVDAAAARARTRDGRELTWSTLVLCPGMVEDWDATPGLRSAYDQGWAASTYVSDAAPRVWPMLEGLTAGRVLFTVPPEPAPCAPTALKPLLMACDHWRRRGVLDRISVTLVMPEQVPTGLAAADDQLEAAFTSYGVEVLRQSQVASVDPTGRSVTVRTPTGTAELGDLAVAHVVPHYRAPQWIADSGLAVDDSPGLVDIDPQTLRHRAHPAVWAIGDAANLATRSSGGALRHQVKLLAKNLDAARTGGKLASYDGYTVMPVTTARHKLLIAEVDRNGKRPRSARLLGLHRPRTATWALDRYVLPQVYWRRILRGKV